MRVVAKRTGLSAHVIRVWERRYGAVQPVRTDTNRRLYRDADIERLRLLHQATVSGHSIGQVARLGEDQLRKLVSESQPAVQLTDSSKPPGTGSNELAMQCLKAVRSMDAKALEASLQRSVVALGSQGLLSRVAAPLSQQVGDLWRAGEITAAHEHFLTAALREFLHRHSLQFAISAFAPSLIVATPMGQLHELGAVIVAAAANNVGWRVTYLGTNLPSAEIAGAAIQQQSKAVALSIVYPEDDPALTSDLRQLRSYLPSEMEVIAGGRGALAYAAVLEEIKARTTRQLEDLYPLLEKLRTAGVNGTDAATVIKVAS